MFEEFKKFALRGNAIDMAVGIVIGAAFGNIVKSLVDDVIMPPIGVLLGGFDFADYFILLKDTAGAAPYETLLDAQAAGAVTLNYGLLVNNMVSFVIVALALFLLIRGINQLQGSEPPPDPTTKECPHCLSKIPIKATRCPHCTSDLADS